MYSPAPVPCFLVRWRAPCLVSSRQWACPAPRRSPRPRCSRLAGLPIPFIAISQPISQIVDMGRTALNVAGAANTAVIVAATEKDLDKDLYYGRKEFED